MAFSTKPFNKPLGLQRLSELSSLEVHSKRTWTRTDYEFRECSGEVLFSANEEPRGWFSFGWGFSITLLDKNNVEVIRLRKPNSFGLGKLEVSLQGRPVSIVRQKRTSLKPVLEISDANDVPAYKLKGPWQLTTDFQFQLTTLDKVPLGAITKKYGGWRKELMSRRDDYIITFPQNLETKYKAACIGASLFINQMRQQRQQQ